jgi:hypothetical protein
MVTKDNHHSDININKIHHFITSVFRLAICNMAIEACDIYVYLCIHEIFLPSLSFICHYLTRYIIQVNQKLQVKVQHLFQNDIFRFDVLLTFICLPHKKVKHILKFMINTLNVDLYN